MKIRWSPTDVADLKEIRGYIAKDNLSAARKIPNRTKESVNRYVNFPLSGRPGRVSGTRELVIPETSYLAANTIQGDEVRIATLLHGKQMWPESF